jgi:hypothetical protein
VRIVWLLRKNYDIIISLYLARNRSFRFQEHVFLTFRSPETKIVRALDGEGSKLLMTRMHLHHEFPRLTLIDNFTTERERQPC